MKDNYIRLTGDINKEPWHVYEFICPYCNTKITIGTDSGRYGNVGAFDCVGCLKSFYAADEDNNPNTPLHIQENGK